MKKLTASVIIICIMLIFVRIPDTYASQVTSDPQDTEDTEEDPAENPEEDFISDTDIVSTTDILINSSACCVMDVNSGAVLYYKNMDDRHYPASITKILTSLLLIENADSMDDMITFTGECWNGVNYYQDTNIGTLDGEEMSVETALHAMLLSSANEVCNGAALWLAGSITDFCDMMNERAADIGCTNSHFANPNGLHDDDHYTTAHDMAMIASEAIKNPAFRKITGTYEYTVESTNMRPEGFTLSHKHRMLLYTTWHYDACIGGKTGYTSVAQNTLVTYAEKDGMTLVCVTMENSNGTSYRDTTTALDYCFDNYESLCSAFTEPGTTGSAVSSGSWPSLPFTGFDTETFDFVSGRTGNITLPADMSEKVPDITFTGSPEDVNLAPYDSLILPFGTIEYTLDDMYAGSLTVYASLPSNDKAIISDSMIIHLKENNTSESNEDEPEIIPLTGTDESEGRSAAGSLISEITGDLAKLFSQYFLICIVVLFFILMILILIIFWITHSIRRYAHHRKYRKLRRKRLDSSEKNIEEHSEE